MDIVLFMAVLFAGICALLLIVHRFGYRIGFTVEIYFPRDDDGDDGDDESDMPGARPPFVESLN